MRQPADSATAVNGRDFFTSLLFWLMLGTAAVLLLLLAISPRIVENVELQNRFVRNMAQLATLQDEANHLAEIEEALRNDPDFVSRLAAAELHPVIQDGPELRVVSPELGFDARRHNSPDRQLSLPDVWCLPLFEAMASPGKLRERCTVATAVLILAAFGGLSHPFAGEAMLHGIQRVFRIVRGRYVDR
jgi:hypothetical protein